VVSRGGENDSDGDFPEADDNGPRIWNNICTELAREQKIYWDKKKLNWKYKYNFFTFSGYFDFHPNNCCWD
jgi:hypothetical protein